MYFLLEDVQYLQAGLRTLIIPIIGDEDEPVESLRLADFGHMAHLEVLKLRADAKLFVLNSSNFFDPEAFTKLHTLEALDCRITGPGEHRHQLKVVCLTDDTWSVPGTCALRRLRLQYMVKFSNTFIENLPVSNDTLGAIRCWFPDLTNLAVGVDSMAGLSAFKHMDSLAVTVNGQAADTALLPDTRILFLGCFWADANGRYVRNATCNIRGLARMSRLERGFIVARHHCISGYTDPALEPVYRARPGMRPVRARFEIHSGLATHTMELFKAVRSRTSCAYHSWVSSMDQDNTHVDVILFPGEPRIGDIGDDPHLIWRKQPRLAKGWATYSGALRDLHWDPLDEPRDDRMFRASWSPAFELDDTSLF
ncbi:hypothetical protein WJX72_002377 [[Myrmecia] bisecta]|uniref:Uncharacterized protein n=1 Tax=[Myrmecia] bisecta TaxID=41462 RepID=A0AAW1PX14_9CHLO